MATVLLRRIVELLSVAGHAQKGPQHNIQKMHEEQTGTAKCLADTEFRHVQNAINQTC